MFTALWIGWIIYFVAVEAVALLNSRDGDTLSEHVWAWFGTEWHKGATPRQRSGWTQLRRIVLLAFLVWLTAHFMTGGWV